MGRITYIPPLHYQSVANTETSSWWLSSRVYLYKQPAVRLEPGSYDNKVQSLKQCLLIADRYLLCHKSKSKSPYRDLMTLVKVERTRNDTKWLKFWDERTLLVKPDLVNGFNKLLIDGTLLTLSPSFVLKLWNIRWGKASDILPQSGISCLMTVFDKEKYAVGPNGKWHTIKPSIKK